MNVTAPNLALVYHLPAVEDSDIVFDRMLGGSDESPDTAALAAIVACTADTHADMLEEAFTLTNSIDAPWHANKPVLSTGFSRRSTSVGDFVQIGMHIYRCDPTGWTHVAPTKWALIKGIFVS